MIPARVGMLFSAFILMSVAHGFAAQIEDRDHRDGWRNPMLDRHTCKYFGCGVAFSIDLKTGAETTLHDFHENGTDGFAPVGGMVKIGDAIYGATAYGGASGAGTIFAIDTATANETVLYAFKGGKDGSHPQAGLTKVGRTIYGTTSHGGEKHCGASRCGVVFSVNPDTGVETVIYSFNGADGYYPAAGLIAVAKFSSAQQMSAATRTIAE